MQPIVPGMAVVFAALLAGCAAVSSDAVESSQSGDTTIVIRGRYTESSNALHALEEAMGVEANKRCSSGWTKVSDENNPSSLTGGRIWRIRCNPTGAKASALAAAPPPSALAPAAGTATAASAGITAAAASAATPGSAALNGLAPGSQATATAAAALTASSPAGVIRREDLVRMLAAAVKRASPYLTDSAAEAIVAEQLRTLAGAKVEVLGPNGQPLPLLPTP